MPDRIWNLFALLGLLSFCLCTIVVAAGALSWLFEQRRRYRSRRAVMQRFRVRAQ